MDANLTPVLALHGGAGKLRAPSYDRELIHLRACLDMGRALLDDGATALDAVTAVTRELEDSGLYIAGRGASPNPQGEYELDACVMDGATRRIGAVAALRGYQNPIVVARLVLQEARSVLYVGDGAAAFADIHHAAHIADPAAWFTGAARQEVRSSDDASGTVGCVARDRFGNLAAATSTGGIYGKAVGRVGDTPLAGSGTWADDQVAVSCTGLGEYFIRVAAAAQIALRCRLAGEDLAGAADAMLAEVVALGGYGGCIAINAQGVIALPFRAEGMKRAAYHADGRVEVAVW